MIDISRERLITFAEAARLRPPSRAGRPTHVATVHRWRLRGLRGARPEAVRLGGVWYTSYEALQRFAARLAGEAAVTLAATGTPADGHVQSDQTGGGWTFTGPRLTVSHHRAVVPVRWQTPGG